MDSSSSDDTGSDMLESLTEISSMRKSHRTGLSRGERSKRPLEDSDDSSDTGQKKELAPLSWHQSTSLGAVPSLGLTNDPGSSSRMSFEFDDDDSEMDDQDIEERNILDGPYGLGSPSFCWPPPGVENVITNEGDKKLQGDKKRKPGIIYLSSIPIGYNVSRTTGFFSQFGRVGRVFLQPDLKERSKRKDKLARNFTEGWVEFTSKRIAKGVAENLNMTQVGGKKRSKSHDVMWNIKYLPGFKWTNLSERLAYEKAVHQQRMRTEISQAKRETDYFKANVEKSKRENVDKMDDNTGLPLPVAKKSRRNVTPIQDNPIGRRIYEFRQKETDDAIRKRKLSELTQKKMANEKLEQGQEFNANFKNSSPPEKKHKNGKSTKEHEKTKKALDLPFASPRNASKIMANSNVKAEGESRSSYSNANSRNATAKKGDTSKLPHSPAKTCSSKNSKSKLIETATSNSLLGGKSCTTGPPTVSTKTNSKSKTRSGVSSKRRESHGTNDRTEFLKSVLL